MKLTADHVRKVKQSVIRGPWGKWYCGRYNPYNNTKRPFCIMGHNAFVANGGINVFIDYNTENQLRALAHEFDKSNPMIFNDSEKTTRWDVIAYLGKLERFLRTKENAGATTDN